MRSASGSWRPGTLLALCVLLLVLPFRGASASQEETEPSPEKIYRGEEIAFFTEIHIPANEVLQGLVCIGCDAVVEGDIKRDIVVISGSVTLSGKVGHDMVCVLSNVELKEGAEVGHDFVNVLGSLEDPGIVVRHQRMNIPIFFTLPGFKGVFGILGAIVAWGRLLSLLFLFVIILVLAVFVPERVRTISDEVPVNLGMAYAVGLLGYLVLWLVVPVIYVLLAASVVGIPVIILCVMAIFVLKTLGLAGIFHYLGRRWGRGLNREMSLLGAILLGFLPFALILVLPPFFGLGGILSAIAISFLFALLVKVPAVGFIILTRGGARPRGPATSMAPPAQAPPEPPPPPSPPPAAEPPPAF